MKLTRPQLQTLLNAYIFVRVWKLPLYCSRGQTIASKKLYTLGLVRREREDSWTEIQPTRRGSKLLLTEYLTQTLDNLALSVDTWQGNIHTFGWHNLRSALRYVVTKFSVEQLPELLVHKSPLVRELASRRFRKLRNETKQETAP